MSDSLIILFGNNFKFNEGQFQFKNQPLSVVHRGQSEVVGIKKLMNMNLCNLIYLAVFQLYIRYSRIIM